MSGGWHQVTSQRPRLKPILGLGFGLEVPWEEGRTKGGTYDKLVAAEIAFTVDHSVAAAQWFIETFNLCLFVISFKLFWPWPFTKCLLMYSVRAQDSQQEMERY